MSEIKKFIELAKAKIQETRSIIISKNDVNAGFTLAQQVTLMEGTRETLLFIKGAIHIDDIEGIYNLRDALNEVLNKETQEAK